MDADPHNIRQLVFRVSAIISTIPVRTEVQAGGEGRTGEFLLAVSTQLSHCSVLTNALHSVFLDEFANRASHEEAGRFEALP